MLQVPTAILAFILLAGALARAQEGTLPDRLTFGYAEEGKIDASPAACDAFVKYMVEWDEPEMKRAIKDVCTARKRHVDAYEAVQRAYAALRNNLFDVRIEAAVAILHFQSMVKACIDHKLGLTPGGHNIGIDIIPNEIAAQCLNLGARLLNEERAWFEGQHQQRASP
jgi:hypothetical protein